MCGILGFIDKRSFDTDAFGKALDVMQNRGPDDRGIYEEPECLLGHPRLATRDAYQICRRTSSLSSGWLAS